MEADFTQARRPAVAGAFYPGDPERLAAQVAKFLAGGAPAAEGEAVRALVVPHAGYEYSGAVAGRAYALLRSPQEQARIRRVVVAAPTHRVPFRGVSLGDYGAFTTPLGEVPVDAGACSALAGAHPLISTRTDAHSHEHALEVQLPFVQAVLPQAKLVPLVCGELSPADARALAPVLRDALWNPETLWVISSDFTHFGTAFGYVPFTRDVPRRISELDHGAIARICAGDLDGLADYLRRTGATICGAHPIELLLAILECGLRPEGIGCQRQQRSVNKSIRSPFSPSRGACGSAAASSEDAERKNGKTEETKHAGTPPRDPAALVAQPCRTEETKHAGAPQATERLAIREVAYATSGQLTGDWEHTVSYAAIAVLEEKFEIGNSELGKAGEGEPEDAVSAAETRTLLKLAREAIRTRLARESAPKPAPEELTPRLERDGACFVTLHAAGELRGCIGHLEASEPLWKNVVRNARSAAFGDPRFFPLSAEEFGAIDLEISVLTPFRPVPGPEAFEVGRHGILMEKGGNHAVFLPQVAPEQGWDRETTLTHLSLKAGLPPDGWRRGAKFFVFEAIVFGEKAR